MNGSHIFAETTPIERGFVSNRLVRYIRYYILTRLVCVFCWVVENLKSKVSYALNIYIISLT